MTDCGCVENRKLSRRGFLGRAAGAGAAAALTTMIGDGVASRFAFAGAASGRSEAEPAVKQPRLAAGMAATPYTGDTLVVLSLRGGFDGLSAVVPHGDADYYKARPTIAVPKASLIGGDAMFGLHPALAPLLPFWQRGQLAAVHAVGQPNPTRSHFAAMEEMERAA